MSLQGRNRKRGKDAERAIAKLVNGKRIGILGSEDVEHPTFSIEVKSRQKFIAEKWMQQAERNAPIGKVPLVVVHVVGQPFEKSFVVMRMQEWKRHGAVTKGRSTHTDTETEVAVCD